MKNWDEQAKYNIAQVIATMAIEDMTPDSRTLENLEKISASEKTADQIIMEIKKEYENG